MGEANLGSLLLEHPYEDERPLLHSAARSVTAGSARAGARALAARLTAAGVDPGRGVLLQLPNDPDTVVAMAAVWLAGGVVIPANPRQPAPVTARMRERTAPVAALSASGLETFGDGRRYEPGTALVLWTSGTTGEPKPIVHRHDAYLELLDRVLGPLRAGGSASDTPPNLIPVPLTLNAGIYNALFGLRAGTGLVIMERFETAAFAELVHRFGIRSTVLPPAAITMLNDDPAVDDLAPLRYVRSITAPLSPLQARRFTDRFGAFVLNGYGQAELGEVIGWTAADARAFPEKLGAAGRPHPGVDVKVVGGGATEPGRLLVRAPNRAAGYAGGGDLDDRVDADGYLDTGDLARVDEDGFVWIEGRAGDVINRGGHKVFPGAVEEVLRLAPGVSDAAVVGVADDRLGEVPVAFVTGRDLDVGELERLCREHLVPYQVPVAIRPIDALPRDGVGKVQRRQLAALHERLTPP